MSFDDVLSPITPTGTTRFALGFRFPGSDRPAALISKPAGVSNRPYQNARRAILNRMRGGGKWDAEQEASFRKAIAKPLAAYVVVGWEDVYETPGVATPFSPAKCEELLLAILRRDGADVFDAYLNYVSDMDNFRDNTGGAGNAEELGK